MIVLSLGSGGAVNERGCPHCKGQGFESPQLHQLVCTSRHDFLRHRTARHSRGFAAVVAATAKIIGGNEAVTLSSDNAVNSQAIAGHPFSTRMVEHFR
jgi:hypothetical protein